MSDLDVLREVVGQLPPPKYEDLVAVSRKRRRRTALGAAAGAAALVLGVGLAGAAVSGSQHAMRPVQLPSPTGSASTSGAGSWTPEQIRAAGLPVDDDGQITTDSGLATQVYLACNGSPCPPDDPPPDGQMAVEVSQNGRSAVFDLHYSLHPWVKAFDGDSVLVQDAEERGKRRYRLLQADGTAVQLQMVDDPAPAVPAPGVVVIDDWTGWNVGLAGSEDLYLVDEGAATLRPVDVPKAVRYWGPNLDQFLWGATDDCRVFWATGGNFEKRRLDCADGLDFTSGLNTDEFPPGWLQPGRMAVVEQFDPGNRTAVHVSLDGGTTWQRVPVTGQRSPTDVLRQLG
jgi:hypothetical protein